jgi:alkaline phosphatase D
MAQRDVKQGSEQAFWTDGWDGYPAARTRLLTDIADVKPPNPLVISGDVHSAWVSDLKPEFDNAKSAVVAIEFCGTSITSQGPSAKQVQVFLDENPHETSGQRNLDCGRVRCGKRASRRAQGVSGIDYVHITDVYISGLMPAFLMSRTYFSMSLRIVTPNCSGLSPTGS